MKRYAYLSLAAVLCITLISWGTKGHKVVARIAEQHLRTNLKGYVSQLLKGQSIADIASWADDVRNSPEYKHTASWHYANVPLGLTYEQFSNAIQSQENNVYKAIKNCEAQLLDTKLSDEQKATALKFLIHFVADAHQPMHVSRAEDKGGNTIQLRFDDKGTNLHSVWDSKLIAHEGLSDSAMVKEYDAAPADSVKLWQNDDPMIWLWESYLISSHLYNEVASDKNLNEDYYRSHIAIVHHRIDQAGIRLAGVLNSVLTARSVLPSEFSIDPVIIADGGATPVDLKTASKMIGKKVITSGKIYSIKAFPNMTLVNLGGEYPNQILTVVLKGQAKDISTVFMVKGKTLGVTGTVVEYKGKPEIEVASKNFFSVD